MMRYILLNQPQSNSSNLNPNSTPTPHQSVSTSINFPGFIILPLTEHIPSTHLKPARSSLPNRHPTYLLSHFPNRPHYYLPHTVGAQAGYCLSPLPPCTKDQGYSNPTTAVTKTLSIPSNKLAKLPPPCHLLKPHPTSASSSSSSSVPSSSNTTGSSSSSLTPLSSLLPLTGVCGSKTADISSTSALKNHQTASFDFETPLLPKNEVDLMDLNTITNKVLPIPPSLSNRVRQIFVNKINTQQAASCAQLPRRKKKPVVQPVA